jgi:hypothetical protein
MSNPTTTTKDQTITFPFYLTAYQHALKHGIRTFKLKRIVTQEGWVWELRWKKESPSKIIQST